MDRLTDGLTSSINDHLKDADGRGFPFHQADYLWESFQKKITEFVNTHRGNAAKDKVNTAKKNPDWKKVKDVLDGKAPFSSLNINCN